MENEYFQTTIQQLMELSDDGADIIKRIYPQSEACFGTSKKFAIRDEKTPSASWWYNKKTNRWCITDFGDDGKARDCFDVVMDEMQMEWYPALNWCIQQYGLSVGKGEDQQNIVKSNPGPDDVVGSFTFQEIEMDRHDYAYFGSNVDANVLREYGWIRVSETRKVYDGYVLTKHSSPGYPIYLRKSLYLQGDELKHFYKIYEPLNRDKSCRFRCDGEKPRNYINGLYEAQRVVQQEEEQQVADERRRPLVICCGERDAACAAAAGCLPIWFNSESGFPKDEAVMKPLRELNRTLYFVPDLDTTGIYRAREFALRFPDIRTLCLPLSMREQKDWRGNPKKDLRDWFSLPGSDSRVFRQMLTTASKADYFIYSKKGQVTIDTAALFNYLWLNGYGSFEFPAGNGETRLGFAYANGFMLEEVTDANKVIKFLQDKLPRDKNYKLKFNCVFSYRSKLNLDSFTGVPPIPFQVWKPSPDVHYMFMKNEVVEITPDKIRIKPVKDSGLLAFKEDVAKHPFRKPKQEPFEVDLTDPKHPVIKILGLDSFLFQMIVNTSRVCWMAEFLASGLTLEEYYEKYPAMISSPLLNETQRSLQMQCLANKLFAIGWLFSTYKKPSEQWAAYWVDLMSSSDVANGRSGKGTILNLLNEIMSFVPFDGRNAKLSEYQHAFDRVTPLTRRLHINDFNPHIIDFGYYYNAISDGMVVNPKNKPQFSLSFSESPKLLFSSNYLLDDSNPSTHARVLCVPCSDWYHVPSQKNGYAEEHTPVHDFGINLGADYKTEDWMNDINFIIHCIQFYQKVSRLNIRIEAPAELIELRRQSSSYSQEFDAWAQEYFADDLDGQKKERSVVFADYQQQTNDYKMSALCFRRCLQAWLTVNNWEMVRNTTKDGRFTEYSPITHKTEEFFLFRKVS